MHYKCVQTSETHHFANAFFTVLQSVIFHSLLNEGDRLGCPFHRMPISYENFAMSIVKIPCVWGSPKSCNRKTISFIHLAFGMPIGGIKQIRCRHINATDAVSTYCGVGQGISFMVSRKAVIPAPFLLPRFNISSILYVSSQPRLWFPLEGGRFFSHRNWVCWWLHTNVIHCARERGVGRFIKRNTTLALYLAIVWDANCVH